MLKKSFYEFILYTDLGEKIRDVVNGLFPGLIPEPKRVRVPVTPPRDVRRRNTKIR